MNKQVQDYFDSRVEAVIPRLPDEVQRIIEFSVPIQVEDFPSEEVMEEMGIEYPDELCGLFTGVALTDRSVEDAAPLPDQVILYRLGIVYAVLDADEFLPDEYYNELDEELDRLDPARIDESRLDEEIRVTILHELGHLHGLDEDELDRLGYA